MLNSLHRQVRAGRSVVESGAGAGTDTDGSARWTSSPVRPRHPATSGPSPTTDEWGAHPGARPRSTRSASRPSTAASSAGSATRQRAAVVPGPTLTVTSWGLRAVKARSSVTSSPAYSRPCTASSLRSVSSARPFVTSRTDNSMTFLPRRTSTPSRSPRARAAAVSRAASSGVAVLVCTTTAAGLRSSRPVLPATCAARRVPSSARRSASAGSRASSTVSSRPSVQVPRSAPWLPTTKVPLGGRDNRATSARGRPDTTARCTDAAASRSRARDASGSGRLVAGSSTSGASTPSKSSATSTPSLLAWPARRRRASSSVLTAVAARAGSAGTSGTTCRRRRTAPAAAACASGPASRAGPLPRPARHRRAEGRHRAGRGNGPARDAGPDAQAAAAGAVRRRRQVVPDVPADPARAATAVSTLDEALRRLAGQARSDGVLVALDFDGVLAPLVDDPATSRPLPEASRALDRLAAASVHLAVVSGRPLADVARLSRPPSGTFVVGSHGAERGTWTDGRLETVELALGPAEADLLAELGTRLEAQVAGSTGRLERKPAAVVGGRRP